MLERFLIIFNIDQFFSVKVHHMNAIKLFVGSEINVIQFAT